MGELHYFLGVKVVQDKESGDVRIRQPAYATSVLQKYGMENVKTVNTPVDTSTKLMKAKEDEECVDQQRYQSAVGSLLSVTFHKTRHHICSKQRGKVLANPTEHHLTAVKCIFRYLKRTFNHDLLYRRNESTECVGFSDTDWGGNLDDRK